jgi:hypothetical protein
MEDTKYRFDMDLTAIPNHQQTQAISIDPWIELMKLERRWAHATHTF